MWEYCTSEPSDFEAARFPGSSGDLTQLPTHPGDPPTCILQKPALLLVLFLAHGQLLARAWDGFFSHCLIVPPHYPLPQGPFFSFHSKRGCWASSRIA